LVAKLRSLHQPKGRKEQDLILLEGTHLLQECERLQLEPQLICSTDIWAQRHPCLLQLAPRQIVSPEVLRAMASTENPDGVVSLLAMPSDLTSLPLLDLANQPLLLALDRVQDPGNLGTLLRTSLAAGVDQVWLGGGADPWQPKVLRASAGAVLQLQLKRWPSLVAGISMAKQSGFQVLAAVQRGGRPYWEVDWQLPSVLLLGNEGAGLAAELIDEAQLVTVPHREEVESLNVAVAAGLMLMERNRQTHRALHGRGESSIAELHP
jgi:TrmH family RNA methyltransferase